MRLSFLKVDHLFWLAIMRGVSSLVERINLSLVDWDSARCIKSADIDVVHRGRSCRL